MRHDVTISNDGRYRYRLARTWDESLPRVTWILLNPSTADGERDDPTVRRCVGFAHRWGYGSVEILNLFAYRSVTPRALMETEDPVGPQNQAVLAGVEDGLVVAGWGATATPLKPLDALTDRDLSCLGTTNAGHPRHPLYVGYDTPLRPWQIGRPVSVAG